MELRTGMWVETDQGVGIAHLEKVDKMVAPMAVAKVDEWQVHLTNPDGATMLVVRASDLTGVRQARAASIPAARVAHMSDEQLAALGYV